MISFQSLVEAFGGILDLLFPIAVAFALLFFLWGMATFILASGDTKRIQEGKDKIKWGLIALFVMVSIWGIIAFFQGSIFGFHFVPGTSGGGYMSDGEPCPIEIQGSPDCAYDENGVFGGYSNTGSQNNTPQGGLPIVPND